MKLVHGPEREDGEDAGELDSDSSCETRCQRCRQPLDEADEVCGACGASQENSEPEPAADSSTPLEAPEYYTDFDNDEVYDAERTEPEEEDFEPGEHLSLFAGIANTLRMRCLNHVESELGASLFLNLAPSMDNVTGAAIYELIKNSGLLNDVLCAVHNTPPSILKYPLWNDSYEKFTSFHYVFV